MPALLFLLLLSCYPGMASADTLLVYEYRGGANAHSLSVAFTRSGEGASVRGFHSRDREHDLLRTAPHILLWEHGKAGEAGGLVSLYKRRSWRGISERDMAWGLVFGVGLGTAIYYQQR